MVQVDEVETELVIEGEPTHARADSATRFETQLEHLREVIRAVVREEFIRYGRIEALR